MRTLRVCIAVGLVVLVAACGSSGGSKGGSGTTAASGAPKDTTLGPGVTDSTVKIGVSLIDFDCIKQFTDTIRVDQERYWQAFADDINRNQGGMGGRQVQLVMNKSCPINANQASAVCTKFTEDEKVFAVVGLIYDTTGAGQACIAKQHKTPMIAYLLSQALMDKAPPGMMVSPGGTPERIDKVLVKLLGEQKTLEGKKVAVLAGAANKKVATDSIIPSLKSLGVDMGTPALLNISASGDTTSAQSQLDSFIEKWKSEGVDTVFLSGDEASSKQFVEKVRKELPHVMLLSDTYTVLNSARDEKTSGATTNPYEGIISVGALTAAEYARSAQWKKCAEIYTKQTGKPAVDATQVVKTSDGKTNDVFSSINDPCVTLALLKLILDKAGKPLNATNWVDAVNNIGTIHPTQGGNPYASLHTGKYDADDTFRLVAFDSSLGATGDYKPLTAIENIANP